MSGAHWLQNAASKRGLAVVIRRQQRHVADEPNQFRCFHRIAVHPKPVAFFTGEFRRDRRLSLQNAFDDFIAPNREIDIAPAGKGDSELGMQQSAATGVRCAVLDDN